MVQIVAVLLGLAGGVVAWFAANFYGRSLVTFFELRSLAHEEMLFSANLRPEIDWSLFTGSGERLRRIASRLKALHETSAPAVRLLWSLSRYAPGAAADALVGYAYSYDLPDRRRFRADVERALRFKLWSEPSRPTATSPQLS